MSFPDRLSVVLSTLFFVGYMPVPGTAGSIAALALFWLLRSNLIAQAVLTLFFISAGMLLAGRAEMALGRKDASPIVIDEASGMMVSLLFLPVDFRIAVSGFVIFRVLDILKPYPAAAAERLKGSPGIMVDDLIAGVYTNCILQVAVRVIVSRLS